MNVNCELKGKLAAVVGATGILEGLDVSYRCTWPHGEGSTAAALLVPPQRSAEGERIKATASALIRPVVMRGLKQFFYPLCLLSPGKLLARQVRA